MIRGYHRVQEATTVKLPLPCRRIRSAARNRFDAGASVLAVIAISVGCSAPEGDDLTAVGEYDETANGGERQTGPTQRQTAAQRLNELVEQSRADLASRLGVDAAAITVVEARHVLWPDGSAGCPMPEYDYIQMLTEGVLIRLNAEGRTFHYHSGVAGPAVYCAKPSSAAPPSKFVEK